jgi:hypothetical protein
MTFSHRIVSLGLTAAVLAGGFSGAGVAETILPTSIDATAWTPLQDGPANSTQVAATSDPAGRLHVVTWSESAGSQLYQYRSIAADGAIATPISILSGWYGLDYPSLLVRGDGTLSLLFFGNRSGDTADPYSGVHTKRLTSDSAFATWTLDSVLYDGLPGLGFPGANAAALFGSDQEVVASAQGGVIRAFNLSTSTAIETTDRICCAYLANLSTVPSTGELVAGFYSNSHGDGGLFFQTVLPALGALTKAPDSGADPRVTVPLAKAGGSLYTAYSNESLPRGGVRIWKVGGAASERVDIPDSEGATGIILVSDGERLWVVWGVADGTSTTYARRSNRDRTAFGRPIKLDGPPGSLNTYFRSAVADRGHLDLFSTANGDANLGSYYARVGVPLEITGVRPTRLPRGAARYVRVLVTDGDNPVSGATVAATPGRRPVRTNSSGIARVQVGGRGRSATITATKTLYTPVTVQLPRR